MFKDDLNDSKLKTVINGVETIYELEDDKVILEKTGNNVIYYIRNNDNDLIGLKYNTEFYYYIKNIHNDIIGLLDNNYNVIANYQYDSYGNILKITDNNGNIITNNNHIAIINPYRYRSYYYDKETNLYYLNSRYYNPCWGRFLNIDDYLGQFACLYGYNLYQYAFNNPISYVDNDARFPKLSDMFNKAKKVIKDTSNYITSTVKSTIEKVKKAFVFEAGLGFGMKVGFGNPFIGADIGFSKTSSVGISDGKKFSATGSTYGWDINLSDKEALGVSIEVTHIDHFGERDGAEHGNIVQNVMEVKDCENTTISYTYGFTHEKYGKLEDSGDEIFIGISGEAFLGAGGFFKIGFNIGGN